MKKIEKEKTRYYYIPVATKFVEYDGEQLINILANLDDEIVRREEEYLSFFGDPLWETPVFENYMEKYKRETQKKYIERDIIEKIGVVYEHGKYREIRTNTPLSVSSDIWLNLPQNKINKEDLEASINKNRNYNNQVNSFFNSYQEKKTSSKVKIKR